MSDPNLIRPLPCHNSLAVISSLRRQKGISWVGTVVVEAGQQKVVTRVLQSSLRLACGLYVDLMTAF